MTPSVELPKRRALGKGLESLLPGRSGFTPPPAPTAAPAPDEGKPREIPVDQIERNPFQTRAAVDEGALKELSASIAASGVVQPVLVRPLADNRFQLIAGERRWLASKLAGKTTVPAILRHVSDEQAMEITIVENLQRTDLNPMEQARAYDRLAHHFKMTQEQMAQRTGKDRASVANFLTASSLAAGGAAKSGKRQPQLRPCSNPSQSGVAGSHPQGCTKGDRPLHVRPSNRKLCPGLAQPGKDSQG